MKHRTVIQDVLAVAFNPAHNAASIHSSSLSSNFAPITENSKGGDAAYIKAGTQVLILFCVYLDQTIVGFKLVSSCCIGWCHTAARTTPRSPEVYNNRQVGTINVLIKTSLVQFNRVACKQWSMAFAAIACIIQAIVR